MHLVENSEKSLSQLWTIHFKLSHINIFYKEGLNVIAWPQDCHKSVLPAYLSQIPGPYDWTSLPKFTGTDNCSPIVKYIFLVPELRSSDAIQMRSFQKAGMNWLTNFLNQPGGHLRPVPPKAARPAARIRATGSLMKRSPAWVPCMKMIQWWVFCLMYVSDWCSWRRKDVETSTVIRLWGCWHYRRQGPWTIESPDTRNNRSGHAWRIRRWMLMR